MAHGEGGGALAGARACPSRLSARSEHRAGRAQGMPLSVRGCPWSCSIIPRMLPLGLAGCCAALLPLSWARGEGARPPKWRSRWVASAVPPFVPRDAMS